MMSSSLNFYQVLSIMAKLRIINDVDTVLKLGQTRQFMWGSGKIINQMAKGNLHIILEIIMREIGSIQKHKVLVNMSSPMVMFTSGSG